MERDPVWLRWVADSVAGVFSFAEALLRIPGPAAQRVSDLVRLSLVTRVWPGRESRLYRVGCGDGAAASVEPAWQELPLSRTHVEIDDRPVAILLHGYCSTTMGAFFSPLKAWLTAPDTGRYGLVLAFECDTLQRRVPDLAEELRGSLERLGLLQGNRRIDLYTHSMGGLTARWLLENPDSLDGPAQRTIRASVRRLIMAGPPNLGTPVAELGDRLLTVLQREGARLPREAGPVAAALQLPLVCALVRRVAGRVPSARAMLQVLDDVQPGSPLLTALGRGAGADQDAPAYHLIQGIYDPVPVGEPVAVRLLREAGALIGDCDARWSDLIVSTRSQAGFLPPGANGAERVEQDLVLPQTWHHQYWSDPATFATIRARLLDRLPM